MQICAARAGLPTTTARTRELARATVQARNMVKDDQSRPGQATTGCVSLGIRKATASHDLCLRQQRSLLDLDVLESL
jgi:hypothetical protein